MQARMMQPSGQNGERYKVTEFPTSRAVGRLIEKHRVCRFRAEERPASCIGIGPSSRHLCEQRGMLPVGVLWNDIEGKTNRHSDTGAAIAARTGSEMRKCRASEYGARPRREANKEMQL